MNLSVETLERFWARSPSILVVLGTSFFNPKKGSKSQKALGRGPEFSLFGTPFVIFMKHHCVNSIVTILFEGKESEQWKKQALKVPLLL